MIEGIVNQKAQKKTNVSGEKGENVRAYWEKN